jgi:A/G-specific adenine glycosylase
MQGMEYYFRFIEAFPDVQSLSSIPEEKILKLWQGLGYYSRARNMLIAANQIMNEFNGKFPDNYRDLLKLKGVGEYTAAAIASFVFQEPVPTIDGNVARVISRLFNIQHPVNSTLGKKTIREFAENILNRTNPGIHNQAIMEFGALQCVPVKPDCMICPLQTQCEAFRAEMVDKIPVKVKKNAQRNRFFNYLFIHYNDYTFINQRIDNDIWNKLYEFPLIETENELSSEELMVSVQWQALFHLQSLIINNISEQIVHILSHQKIHTRFYEISILDNLPKKHPLNDNYIKIHIDDLKKYPVSRLIDRYLVK